MLVRNLHILYGSQTGTAQDLAEKIGREALRYLFDVKVVEMDDFPIASLPDQHFIVFVCSTTGQGEEPDNMKNFWKFILRKDLPLESLSKLRFAVLGLGDSSYPKFNFAAKKLHKRLLQLGADGVMNPGLADDQHDLGPDAVVNPWLESFWQKTLLMFPIPAGLVPLNKNLLPPSKYSVDVISEEDEASRDSSDPFNDQLIYSMKKPYFSTVKENKKVTTTNHFQDVRLISFNLNDSGITYCPGDVAMIQPHNCESNMDRFFQVFKHLHRRQRLMIKANNNETKLPLSWILPNPCTLEDCVRYYWDLQCVPRRYFFELLAKFSEDELEKEKLEELSSSEGQQDLFTYCNRPRRSLVEVLYDFSQSAARVPINYLFDLIPVIKPRAFSIASSAKVNAEELQVLVAVVEYKTKLSEPRRGLCSTWLSQLTAGRQVPLWIRKGTLRFPTDPQTPVIMVGPGTGCSPFRSYIDDERKTDPGRTLCLFFGCRSKSADFFFAEDWLPLQQQGRLNLFCAFSRDQPEKIYVQHLIEEQVELLSELMVERGAWVFVAGNAKQMPDQVLDALIKVLSSRMTGDQAAAYVKQMQNQSRLQLETWS